MPVPKKKRIIRSTFTTGDQLPEHCLGHDPRYPLAQNLGVRPLRAVKR